MGTVYLIQLCDHLEPHQAHFPVKSGLVEAEIKCPDRRMMKPANFGAPPKAFLKLSSSHVLFSKDVLVRLSKKVLGRERRTSLCQLSLGSESKTSICVAHRARPQIRL